MSLTKQPIRYEMYAVWWSLLTKYQLRPNEEWNNKLLASWKSHKRGVVVKGKPVFVVSVFLY